MTAEPPENACVVHLRFLKRAQYIEYPGLPLFPDKERTMRYASRFIESLFSLAVFLAITLAIAVTSYQLFNPDGGVAHWLSRTWNDDPALLVVCGGAIFLLKRWLGGAQGSKPADLMFYGAVMLGLYYGSGLLVAN